MKLIIEPKCPYCRQEYEPKSVFNNPLAILYGEYLANTVKVVCQNCGEEYYVSKQIRFISRKNK